MTESFTPALGRTELTGLYDAAIRTFTRERRWRGRMMTMITLRAGERLLDVGCGTGTLAVALKRSCPDAIIVGLDPDPAVLEIAAAKAEKAGAHVEWRLGFAHDAAAVAGDSRFDVVVSSLLFHQVPMEEKRAGLAAMCRALKPGGRLVLADYGAQRTWPMRALFRATVQRLDGRENTQPNADGVLDVLLPQAGFEGVTEAHVIPTATGFISLFGARRPA